MISMYLHVPTVRKAVCITPCAGAVSMSNALADDSTIMRQRDVYLLWERKQVTDILMWLRDPLERFQTLFKFKPFEGVDQAFAAIDEWDPDPHWVPQREMHTYSGIFLPTKVYPFSTLAETWAEEFPEHPLPWTNKSTHEKPALSSAQVLWLQSYYAGDYE